MDGAHLVMQPQGLPAFFYDHLHQVAVNLGYTLPDNVGMYTADMLSRAVRTEGFSKFETNQGTIRLDEGLSEHLLENIQDENPQRLARLGDVSLVVRGLFSDRVDRKDLRRAYEWIGMNAYANAAHQRGGETLGEMAENFLEIAEILEGVGHEYRVARLKANPDILGECFRKADTLTPSERRAFESVLSDQSAFSLQ